MFKSLVTVFSAILFSTVAIAQTTTCKPPTGYTPIYDSNGLEQIRSNLTGKFYLCNNITISGEFSPITSPELSSRELRYTAEDYQALEAGSFNGVFNGGGKTISGLLISRPNDMYVGLFRRIGSKGTVSNVTFSAPVITAFGHIGVVAGVSAGVTSSVRVNTPNITAGPESLAYGWGDRIAGVIGYVEQSGSVTGAVVSGGTIKGYRQVGGVVGMLYGNGKIDSSVVNSTIRGIYGSGQLNFPTTIGGIVGDALSVNPQDVISAAPAINKCRSSGIVSARTTVGGLVGHLFGRRIERSVTTAKVEGSDSVGGLAGAVTNAAVYNSYVGLTQLVVVKSSYNGFIGTVAGYAGNSSIAYSYSAGRVVIPTGLSASSIQYLGAVAGYAGAYEHYTQMGYTRGSGIFKSYFDKTKNPALIQYDSYLGSPRTSAQLTYIDTFSGFDISLDTSTAPTIWKIKQGVRSPYLR